MRNKIFCICAFFVQAALAQDEAPFQDFEASPVETKAVDDGSKPLVNAEEILGKKPQAPVETPTESAESDAEIDQLLSEGSESVPAPSPAEVPEPMLPALPTPEDKTLFSDILPTENEALPKAILSGNGEDPGLGLEPDVQFDRVPLRPPMSDANWAKWAGPALEKVYKIQKSDTLWAASERLFGNPYLWPKVWQLNAQLTNPHIVEKGVELQFSPGNVNSAPNLAFINVNGEKGDISLYKTDYKLSFLERLDTVLQTQLRSSQPPFRFFLIENIPEAVGALPVRTSLEGVFYKEGESFPLNLPDGRYSVVTAGKLVNRFSRKVLFPAYKLELKGRVKVVSGKAVIESTFTELEAGDLLIEKEFKIPPLSLHKAQLSEEEQKSVQIVSIQNIAAIFSSQYTMAGLKVLQTDGEPGIGSLVKLYEKDIEVGSGLVVYREGRMATLWIVESSKEISKIDSIR